MDGFRFDTLTRSLGDPHSRRGALRLVAVAVGVLGWQNGEQVAGAHDALLTCKKLKGDKKKKCVKKAKKHNAAERPCWRCHRRHHRHHHSPPPPLVCGTGGPCLAFVTSTTHTGGSLSGLLGGRCNLPATGTGGQSARHLPGLACR